MLPKRQGYYWIERAISKFHIRDFAKKNICRLIQFIFTNLRDFICKSISNFPVAPELCFSLSKLFLWLRCLLVMGESSVNISLRYTPVCARDFAKCVGSFAGHIQCKFFCRILCIPQTYPKQQAVVFCTIRQFVFLTLLHFKNSICTAYSVLAKLQIFVPNLLHKRKICNSHVLSFSFRYRPPLRIIFSV